MIDWLLAGGLLLVAVGVLVSRQLYQAVVMFIAFGLLMALVWIRLEAPDLALAEAAIGAGLTGVLLLDALGHLREPYQPPRSRPLALPLVMTGLLSLCLLAALLHPVTGREDLIEQVHAQLPATGVEHPITGVLLAFRAYDTLLEVAVVLVAVVVGLALRMSHEDQPAASQAHSPLLSGMLAWLAPVMLLVGSYLLWIGSYRSGGAFQSAAVLAALLVLLKLAGFSLQRLSSGWIFRFGAVMGLGFFIAAGWLAQGLGGQFLEWPTAVSGAFILSIELVLSASLALLLYSLFEASPAPLPLQAS